MDEKIRKRIEGLAQNKEEVFLGGRLIELDALAQKRCSAVCTGFLSQSEQAYCHMLKGLLHCRCLYFGGYEEAERQLAVLLPEEWCEVDPEVIAALRLSYTGELSHRDILGGLLATGIERDAVGDILVGDSCSFVLVTAAIAPYLIQNMQRAGRVTVRTEQIPLTELEVPERLFEEVRGTVASLRLDSVLAEGFSLSRETAQEAVKRGLAQVNHRIVENVSKLLSEGDVISLRGYGKMILEAVGGESRKGRVWITLKRFC